MVKSVHHGIDVNPEGCIYWLDERESDVRNQLEAIGLVYER
ncbi:MAG TPA: hypothetical protein VG845_14540 [Dehalococcoidia bacterium]|nr:hypothetical protein [Dehalococcoidia bacterium]